MQPRPSAETSSPCPSIRLSIVRSYPLAGILRRLSILATAHGRPQAKNIEIAPRQASGDAFDQRRQGERLRDVRES
jgi:hypothetical protein